MRIVARAVAATLFTTGSAWAFGVGEAHLMAQSPAAALRDARHRPEIRVTVWYPASDALPETPRTIGPPGKPFFTGGNASDDAPVEAGRFPVLLVSHGFGGSARMMSWFGTELARAGTVVVGVDHPGNNGADPLTIAGAVLWWERADDLRHALQTVRTDARFAGHVDTGRLGVAGFSAGGLTALVAAGARIDLARIDQFCIANPDDGVCRPQVEMPSVSAKDRRGAFDTPELKGADEQASADHAIAGVRGVFVMAPALVQALQPESLRALSAPVRIVLGASDAIAPPATNGETAAGLISRAELTVLGGVGHYDFLSTCTAAGQSVIPLCRFDAPQEDTHRRAIDLARTFFAEALR